MGRSILRTGVMPLGTLLKGQKPSRGNEVIRIQKIQNETLTTWLSSCSFNFAFKCISRRSVGVHDAKTKLQLQQQGNFHLKKKKKMLNGALPLYIDYEHTVGSKDLRPQ